MNWIAIFPKKIYKWSKSIWEDAPYHELPENCKSKLQWVITSYSLGWILLKKKKEEECWWGGGQRGPLCTVVGNINWLAIMKKSMELLQEIKNRIAVWINNPTCRKISKRIASRIPKRLSVRPCLLQHYSQESRGRSSPHVHW